MFNNSNDVLVSSINAKFNSRTRDFGNDNDGWRDQTLSSYLVFDFVNSYQIFDSYRVHLNINNIFNEDYPQAWEYSSPGRSFNFGIKKVN